MNKYLVELHGTVDYDMMPRVKSAKLLCKGFIEDYEIEIDLDVIKIVRIKGSGEKGARARSRGVDGQPTIRESAQPTPQEHPDEKVLWFREGQFDAAEILSGEACTVSLRDPPGSIKPLYEWSLSPDFPKLAGFMIGDESRFRRILGVSKDGDNVIYEVGRGRE